MVTRDEALRRLKELAEDDDYETAHVQADEILADFVRSLGYPDVVDAYEKVGKWYA